MRKAARSIARGGIRRGGAIAWQDGSRKTRRSSREGGFGPCEVGVAVLPLYHRFQSIADCNRRFGLRWWVCLGRVAAAATRRRHGRPLRGPVCTDLARLAVSCVFSAFLQSIQPIGSQCELRLRDDV